MHTKGVSSRVQSWARNIFFWRSVMEYFLIARWRECIDLLEQYDVVGAPGASAHAIIDEPDLVRPNGTPQPTA